MKRSFEILLLIPILLAIVFVAVGFRNGTLSRWFSAETEIPPTVVPGVASPTLPASVLPYFTPTNSAALTQTTQTPATTSTSTSAPTFVVVPPRTSTPLPTRTNTAPPTVTRTPTATNTPAGSATGTPVSQEMLDGISAGNQVIRAIEDYYLNHGEFPPALTDLVPAYLPGVPVTPAEQPYYYRFFDATHPLSAERYWLSFRVSDQQNLTCTYMRRIEYWDCNYASP